MGQSGTITKSIFIQKLLRQILTSQDVHTISQILTLCTFAHLPEPLTGININARTHEPEAMKIASKHSGGVQTRQTEYKM